MITDEQIRRIALAMAIIFPVKGSMTIPCPPMNRRHGSHRHYNRRRMPRSAFPHHDPDTMQLSWKGLSCFFQCKNFPNNRTLMLLSCHLYQHPCENRFFWTIGHHDYSFLKKRKPIMPEKYMAYITNLLIIKFYTQHAFDKCSISDSPHHR